LEEKEKEPLTVWACCLSSPSDRAKPTALPAWKESFTDSSSLPWRGVKALQPEGQSVLKKPRKPSAEAEAAEGQAQQQSSSSSSSRESCGIRAHCDCAALPGQQLVKQKDQREALRLLLV
jgi:hypothetical protein